MSQREQETLLARTRKGPIGPGVERYKKKKEAAGAMPEHSDGQFA